MTALETTRTITGITITLDDDPEVFLGDRELRQHIDAGTSFTRFADLVEAGIRASWTECATADITVTGSTGASTTVTVHSDDGSDDGEDPFRSHQADCELADAISGLIEGIRDNSWGEKGNTWVVGIDPTTFECSADTDEILLYEDNAGHLFYVCGDKVLAGVETLEPLRGCFEHDAGALLAGEVFRPKDGTVWHRVNLTGAANGVARYHRDATRMGGQLEVYGRYGRAAKVALDRSNYWVITNRGQILVQRYIQPDGINRAADFELCDGEQAWIGGSLAVGSYWDMIADDDPRITPQIRADLGWVYEDED